MPGTALSGRIAGQSGLRLGALGLAAMVVYIVTTLVAPRATAGDEGYTQAAQQVDLNAIQQAFERVVGEVSPSVVGIRAQRRYSAGLPASDDADNLDAIEQRVVVNGSGVVIGSNGLILTNEHVVQGAADIDVLLYDGQRLPAHVLASDPRSDLAVLKVARRGLPAVEFCDWVDVRRGQWAIAIGNPFGLGSDGQLSVSIGVVSNLGRQLPGLGEVDDRFYNNMIQTTAPIHPGNSGGPLFNVRGELIGVVTAMHTRAPADEGVGFAIPITSAKRRVIETLSNGGVVRYGYIGLTVRMPTDEELREELPGVEEGVIVERVEPEGPADHANIQVGDVILRYNHERVDGPADMAELVGYTPVGSRVSLSVQRGATLLRLEVVVDEREVSRVSWMRGEAVLWRGMRVADLTDDSRRLMNLHAISSGVVVIDVAANSPADVAGFEIGDIIDQIEDVAIVDTIDFLARVRGVKGTLRVSVHGAGTRLIRP